VITKIEYVDRPEREAVIEAIQGLRVLDVGGARGWATRYADAILDIREPKCKPRLFSQGHACMPDPWDAIIADTIENGSYDFAICTDTLEDLACPQYVCMMMSHVADRGYIAVPSKYLELGWLRASKDWRGFLHHRWVFSIDDEKLMGYPKLPLTNHEIFDGIGRGPHYISVWWERGVKMDVVNGDWLGPDEQTVFDYYVKGLIG
jgi:hypothetical protein